MEDSLMRAILLLSLVSHAAFAMPPDAPLARDYDFQRRHLQMELSRLDAELSETSYVWPNISAATGGLLLALGIYGAAGWGKTQANAIITEMCISNGVALVTTGITLIIVRRVRQSWLQDKYDHGVMLLSFLR